MKEKEISDEELHLRLMFAERLKKALADSGKRQIDLANELSRSKGGINSWLAGRWQPNNLTAIKIASFLDCDPVWLVGLKDVQEFKMTLSLHERKVLEAYRGDAEAQRFIDRALGIEVDETSQ